MKKLPITSLERTLKNAWEGVMKNLIILICIIAAAGFFTQSKAEVLQGELAVEGSEVALYSGKGRMVVTVPQSLGFARNCFDGTFEVENNVLKKVVHCFDKSYQAVEVESAQNIAGQKANFCPMNFNPICGKVTEKVCVAGVCSEKATFVTFGNYCELNSQNAEEVFPGTCDAMKEFFNHEEKGSNPFAYVSL